MTNYPYGSYDPQPRQYPSNPYPAQYPQDRQSPQQYPPDRYSQPGVEDPTAPVVPSSGGSAGGQYGGGQYGGGQYDGGRHGGGQYGGSQYGGGPYDGGQYGGSQYGGSQYGGGPGGGQPPGWGTPPGSPAPSSGGAGWPGAAPQPKPRKTGLIVGLVAGGLVLVLCLGGLAFFGIRALNDEGSPSADENAGPVDSGGGDPFASTPAADFAEGTDGIQLPEAESAGDFSAGDVEEALTGVEEALIAARLDETMLVERDPEPFLSLMAEDNQSYLQEDFDTSNFSYFASQFADGAELAVPTPRVDGEITFEATTDSGGFRVIEVVTSFVWAYAFEVPSDNPELDGVVVVRDQLVWQVPHNDDVAESSRGLWLWESKAYAASGIDCGQFDQSLLSPQTEPGAGGLDGPDEGEIYDPEGSLDFPNTC